MSIEAFEDFIINFVDPDGKRKYEDQRRMKPPFTVIDFPDIWNHNEGMARMILTDPRSSIVNATIAFSSKAHIRGLIQRTSIREIGSALMGGLISVRGHVVKSGEDTSRIDKAVFRCVGCGERTSIQQDSQFLKTPDMKCPNDECGGRKWELDTEQSTYRDSQTVSIQELPENLSPGEVPRRLDIQLLDELVKGCYPGDLVDVTGIVSVRRKSPMQFTLDLERVIEANHVEVLNKQDLSINLTERDIQEIKEASKQEGVMEKMIRSLAPSIYGYDYIKKSIILQLFGSQTIEKKDIRIRGDIHMLLVGEPGTSKTQMLQVATSLSPRGVYTTAGRSSKAGLCAGVVKDERLGGFSIEAGAAVLSDLGVLGLDEVEKMNKDDRAALHPVMEQQVVKLNLAGINAELPARCAILAAGNPASGRYNTYQTVSENLGTLPASLLSRFDLIFLILDKPDQKRDMEMAERILELMEADADTFDHGFMRKYISYAKGIKPTIPKEIRQRMAQYYAGLRGGGNEGTAIKITPRQLESIPRLARARARVELSETVTERHLEEAIELHRRSMDEVGVDPMTGESDIDAIIVGHAKNTQDRMNVYLSWVRKLENMSLDHKPRVEDIKIALMQEGWTPEEVDRVKKILLRDGAIYSPSMGTICVTPG